MYSTAKDHKDDETCRVKNEIHCVSKNKTNFERTERASAARRSEQITEVETRFYFFYSRLLIVTLRSQRRSLF